MPLDFDTPISTHLHTRAFFGALGDDYPDQSLRCQVLNGALFADLALQIVICPHLLSLGPTLLEMAPRLEDLLVPTAID